MAHMAQHTQGKAQHGLNSSHDGPSWLPCTAQYSSTATQNAMPLDFIHQP